MRVQTRAGARIEHHGRVLVPVARSFLLSTPRARAAFVWNRPAGLYVEEGSRKRWLSVGDPTRRIQWGLLAMGLAGVWLARLQHRPEGRQFFRRWRHGRK